MKPPKKTRVWPLWIAGLALLVISLALLGVNRLPGRGEPVDLALVGRVILGLITGLIGLALFIYSGAHTVAGVHRQAQSENRIAVQVLQLQAAPPPISPVEKASSSTGLIILGNAILYAVISFGLVRAAARLLGGVPNAVSEGVIMGLGFFMVLSFLPATRYFRIKRTMLGMLWDLGKASIRAGTLIAAMILTNVIHDQNVVSFLQAAPSITQPLEFLLSMLIIASVVILPLVLPLRQLNKLWKRADYDAVLDLVRWLNRYYPWDGDYAQWEGLPLEVMAAAVFKMKGIVDFTVLHGLYVAVYGGLLPLVVPV